MSLMFASMSSEVTVMPSVVNTGTANPSGTASNTTLSAFDPGATAKTLIVAWACDRSATDAVTASGCTFGGTAMQEIYQPTGDDGRKSYVYALALTDTSAGDIVVSHDNTSTRTLVVFTTDGYVISTGGMADNSIAPKPFSQIGLMDNVDKCLLVGLLVINNNTSASASPDSPASLVVGASDSGNSSYVAFASQTPVVGHNEITWTVTSNNFNTLGILLGDAKNQAGGSGGSLGIVSNLVTKTEGV